MMWDISRNCGVFFLPQMALSVIAVALVVGYVIAWLRRELPAGAKPWDRTLEPLAGIAVSVGLLGSVVGFVSAFGSFQNGIDVRQLTAGLATAYVTTGVGLVTSLISMFGSYVLGMTVKED